MKRSSVFTHPASLLWSRPGGWGGGHLAGLAGVRWFVENVLRLGSGPDQVAPSKARVALFGIVMRPDVLENWTNVGTWR